MSSTRKALELLSHFSAARPEIGLSQLCRMAGRDKATTYRHLQALELSGFVEKNPATRQYRLGPALLQLAQTREATVPRKAGVEGPLSDLAEATGETAHVAILSGTTLYSLAAFESPRHGTRAIIDMDTFSLHATASGLCALAFGPDALTDVARANLQSFTETTAATEQALEAAVRTAQQSGLGRGDGSFEAEVQGLAAPLYDQTGQFAGTVAVASVATRFTPELERIVTKQLTIASRKITHNWGGSIPSNIDALWAKTFTQELEVTS